MQSTFKDVTLSATALAHSIDTLGYARLDGLLDEQDLAHLRTFTDEQALRHPGEYFACHGEQALAGCALLRLSANPVIRSLLAELYRLAAGHESPSPQIFPVLRCVQGTQGRRESNCFHFDASLVTVLIPIYIPEEGAERGDLMLFANVRGAIGSILGNLLHKMLVQNRLSRWLLTGLIRLGWLKPEVVQLVPGSVYLFWGYRSLHANQACSPGLMRATAILHFGDPHSGSLVTRLILRLNQRRARRTSQLARTPVGDSPDTPPAQTP